VHHSFESEPGNKVDDVMLGFIKHALHGLVDFLGCDEYVSRAVRRVGL
jgi:hypothetical protein